MADEGALRSVSSRNGVRHGARSVVSPAGQGGVWVVYTWGSWPLEKGKGGESLDTLGYTDQGEDKATLWIVDVKYDAAKYPTKRMVAICK